MGASMIRVALILVLTISGYFVIRPLRYSRLAMSLKSDDAETVREILYNYKLNTEEIVARFAKEEAESSGIHIPEIESDKCETASLNYGTLLRPEVASVFFVRRDGFTKAFKWDDRGHTFFLIVDGPAKWYLVSRLLSHFQKVRLSYLQFFGIDSSLKSPLWLEIEISRQTLIGTAYSDYLIFTNEGDVLHNGDPVKPDTSFVEKMKNRLEKIRNRSKTASKFFVRLIIEWAVPVQRVLQYVALLSQANGVPVLRLYFQNEINDEYTHFNAIRENRWKQVFGEEEEEEQK
jgi:hypothetical protein